MTDLQREQLVAFSVIIAFSYKRDSVNRMSCKLKSFHPVLSLYLKRNNSQVLCLGESPANI